MKRPAAWLAGLAMLGGCADFRSTGPAAQRSGTGTCPSMSLRLIGTATIEADTRWSGALVGGLSGIDYDSRSNRYLMISDDRGPNLGTRIFTGSIAPAASKGFAVELVAAQQMRAEPASARGAQQWPVGVDGESLRMLGDRRIAWASEGDADRGVPPAIYVAERGSNQGRRWPLPPELVPDAAGTRGPRSNRSFEGLARGADSKSIFLALESPLVEAGEPPTVQHGALSGIYELGADGALLHRFSYPLEPISAQLPGRLADNGVSEMLVVAKGQFLVLERSGSQQEDGGFKYVTRLYCAGADSSTPTQVDGIPLKKRLVSRLNDLGDFDFANFEGMTFGPALKDGGRSLVLVTDNDFRAGRPTVLAVFELLTGSRQH